MIITANSSQFIFDSLTIQTINIASLYYDTTLSSVILFQKGADNRTVPFTFLYSSVTSYNGGAVPSFATLVSGLQGYMALANQATVSGSITANAGTNLNTSALALESGGNLASIKTDLDNIYTRQADGNQRSVIIDEYDWLVENTPMGEMRAVEPVRLVGSNFEGSTIDTRFWISGVANSGDVTQSNASVTLSTKTVATNGMARLYTLRRARYVSGVSMGYRSVITLSAAAANNKRRWGIAFAATMPTTGTTDLITDGAWFQFDGTTFSIALRRAGVANETLVSSGSFNGNLGVSYSPGTTVKTYEIYWTNSKVYFVIGGVVLHTFSADTTTWSSTMNFYVYCDNVNSNNLQTDHTLGVRVASIRRLGGLLSQTSSYYHALGTTAGVNLKLSAGNLHSLILTNVVDGAVITLSDSTTTTTPTLFEVTALATAVVLPIDLKGSYKERYCCCYL
jgi:hypothetical protein